MEGQHEIQLNKPEPFNPNKNSTSADWRIWKQNFLIYIELTEARLKLSKRGLALFLLNLIGPLGIEAKENMTFDDPSEEESMEVLLKKFDEIFDVPLNEIEERYKFFSRRKYDTETIQNYVRCLKEQAAKCNFNKQTEKFILDMVVLNMDNNLQRRIFLTKDLSLPMAIKLYEENLIKEEKMRNVYNSNFDKLNTDDLTDTKKADDYFSQNINKQENKAHNNNDRMSTKYNASKNNCFQPKAKVCGKCSEAGHCSEECNKLQNNFDRQQSSKLYRVDDKNQKPVMIKAKAGNVCPVCGTHHQPNECPNRKKQNNTKRVCYRCNSQHPPRQCPAYNVTCDHCNKLGHFSQACKSKNIQESANCPRCNAPLLPYNEDYVYCKYCSQIYVLEEEEDSDVSSSSESPQPRRRNRRRQRRNRRAQNEDGCCIS